MPEPVDIRQLVNLPPEDAIAFLDAKGYRTSVRWTDTWQDEHASAFTVAKVAKIDLLREIHVSLIDAMATGQTFESWKAELEPKLAAAGWWGRVVDPELTGTDQPVTIGPRRLRTIYDTNLRMARATALWGRIWAGRDLRPFLRYSAVMDRRTRPQHRLWHAIVLPVEHPFWQTHFPPNGWNCRCTVVQLSERDLARRGLTITTEAELTARGFGSATTQFWRRGANGDAGRVVVVPQGIDPGFAYNPGTARARLGVERAAESLTRAAGVPGLIEPALADILDTLPGGRPDRARQDAMIALARAGQIAELAALLAELLGVMTAGNDPGDIETAARGGKRGGMKPISAKLSALAARRTRDAGGRFADEGGGAAPAGPANRADIRRFARESLAKKDGRDELSMGAVLNSSRVKALTGVDIAGYRRVLTGDFIRHSMKRHGPGSDLANQGLPLLRRSDFLRVREVMANADVIKVKGKVSPRKSIRIRYEATIGGRRYVYSEEVWTNRQTVASKTLFIAE